LEETVYGAAGRHVGELADGEPAGQYQWLAQLEGL
jgi:hypothetical protein